MNSWLRKEIRDAIRWAPIAIALMALVSWYIIRTTVWSQFPQISSSLMFPVWMVTGIFGAFLGLVSFLPDMRENARAFLIHRGLEPSRIFHIRIVVGISVYLASLLVPLIALTGYLASVGPKHYPVMPIQILPSLVAACLSVCFYFAGILIACRPCRWYGTRLLPLFFALFVSMGSLAFLQLVKPYWNLFILVPCLVGVWILYWTSLTTFVKGPSQPIVSKRRSTILGERFVLVGATTTLVMIVCFIGVAFVDHTHPGEHTLVRFTQDGSPWLAHWKDHFTPQPTAAVPMLAHAKESDTPNEKAEEISLEKLIDPRSIRQTSFLSENGLDMKPLIDESTYDPGSKLFQFYVYGGRIYVYHTTRGIHGDASLLGIVGSDSVANPSDRLPAPFEGSICLASATNSVDAPFPMHMYVVSKAGVYHVDWDQKENKMAVSHVFKKEVLYFGMSAQPEMCLGTEDGIYVIPKIKEKDSNLYDFSKASRSLAFPLKQLKPNFSLMFHKVSESDWTIVSRKHGWFSAYEIVRSTSSNDEPQSYSFSAPFEWDSKRLEIQHRELTPVTMLCPPGYLGFISLVVDRSEQQLTMPPTIWILTAIQAFIAASLSFLAAYHRGRSTRGIVGWTIAGGIFGVLTWIAVLAIYPRYIRVPCPHCKKSRPLNEEQCPSCNAAWEPPLPLGIEVIEPVQGTNETQPAMIVV